MFATSALPVVAGSDDPLTSGPVTRLAAAEAALHHRPLVLLSSDRSASDGHLPDASYERFAGPADAALIERSQAAHLIVTGVRRPDGADVRHTDGTAARIAAHAGCPTLFVTGPPTVDNGPVLLALDLRPQEAAVDFAFAEAAARRVDLWAIHVAPAEAGGALSTLDPFGYDAEAANGEVDRMLAEALAGWAGKYPDVVVRRFAGHHANVAETLIRGSGMAGLLVVSGRDHPRHSGQLLGSVTATVLGRSACPLAVVPHRPRSAAGSSGTPKAGT